MLLLYLYDNKLQKIVKRLGTYYEEKKKFENRLRPAMYNNIQY